MLLDPFFLCADQPWRSRIKVHYGRGRGHRRRWRCEIPRAPMSLLQERGVRRESFAPLRAFPSLPGERAFSGPRVSPRTPGSAPSMSHRGDKTCRPLLRWYFPPKNCSHIAAKTETLGRGGRLLLEQGPKRTLLKTLVATDVERYPYRFVGQRKDFGGLQCTLCGVALLMVSPTMKGVVDAFWVVWSIGASIYDYLHTSAMEERIHALENTITFHQCVIGLLTAGLVLLFTYILLRKR
ncbi:hypothetical protein SKAU_G00203970 [Synaphobranchus kaupii]|uniref:Uncharacterized protein n=1 Tax=Synaphobranchus kaupii TaxID=118154 RepID=A0A9Q1FG14_SYNKA|nr:hypothetical protein SKAU_G00203970 [Synaphobranchus kaupii]